MNKQKIYTFNINEYSNYILIGSIILLILSILFIISIWKLFKKENIKPWLSIIPIVNIYYLFKICKIPFWTIFIPIVNIVVFYLFPYRLAKQYKCNTFLAILSVLFPYIIVPYIAFSKKENKDKLYNPNYLKTIDDVNKLEETLVNDNDMILDDMVINSKHKNVKSNLNDFVEKIDNNIINDDIIYDEPKEIKENTSNEEIVPDIVDINGNSEISLDDVETLEEDLITDVNQNKTVVENIKDYKVKDIKNEDIAFGGKEIKEFSNEEKKPELKCSKCGASLVGANGYCPGCGTEL